MWYIEPAMNHHKVVVGGFASDRRQLDTVSRKLSEYYDEDVKGMIFREARQNLERLADFISEKDVIAHSAADVLVDIALREYGVKPASITAIAPPIPEKIRHLLTRGFRMGSAVTRNSVTRPYASLRDELLIHAKANFGALPLISRFNALDAARWDADHDIDTTVVVMSQDTLFPSVQYADSVVGRSERVISLHGDHNRFSHEPVQVMSEIALARTMKIGA